MNDMEVYIVPNQKIAEDIPLVNFKVGLKEFEKKSNEKPEKKQLKNNSIYECNIFHDEKKKIVFCLKLK